MSDHVQNLEQYVEKESRKVKLREQLQRLLANPDFNDLIMTHYLKEEPVRLVLLMNKLNGKESESAAHRDMLGIATFHEFLRNIDRFGEQAANMIADAREEIMRVENAESDGE
jgi:hypothetical protein